ncbi:MAG: hypothetical protein OXE85_11695 [Roseovarius sp.]|nr:hypothetical protein [Roseovarius sp.]
MKKPMLNDFFDARVYKFPQNQTFQTGLLKKLDRQGLATHNNNCVTEVYAKNIPKKRAERRQIRGSRHRGCRTPVSRDPGRGSDSGIAHIPSGKFHQI